MGNFLDILKEIESCRMAGFGRPALFEALMLPDICGETRVSEDGNAEKKENGSILDGLKNMSL